MGSFLLAAGTKGKRLLAVDIVPCCRVKKYLVFDLICSSKSGKSITGECAFVV